MTGIVERVYEVRRLAAKCEAGHGLEWDEVHELNSLEAEFGHGDRRRRFPRTGISISALVRRGERTDRVLVADIGPGGLRCFDCPRIREGDTVELQLRSDDESAIYRFVARAAWVEQTDEGNWVGFAFVGSPIQMRKGPPSESPPTDLVDKVRAA